MCNIFSAKPHENKSSQKQNQDSQHTQEQTKQVFYLPTGTRLFHLCRFFNELQDYLNSL